MVGSFPKRARELPIHPVPAVSRSAAGAKDLRLDRVTLPGSLRGRCKFAMCLPSVGLVFQFEVETSPDHRRGDPNLVKCGVDLTLVVRTQPVEQPLLDLVVVL